MKTKLFVLENGGEKFAADLSADVFDFYVNECKVKNVAHSLKGNVLTIANKVVFKLVN